MPRLRRTRSVLVLAVVVLTSASANAGGTSTTYYVSPSGSDTNLGTSASPWQTVARVNRAPLNPGDTVLFQGGASYTDQTLSPSSSGTASSPITFGSYGTGEASISNSNGAVWIPSGVHDLVIDNLDLTSSNSIVFAAAASGTGASGITLQNSTVHDSPYAGVVVQPQDSRWTVHGNTFRHLGDSGLLVQGSSVTIDQNTITDTGWNTALTYGKHGIYAKGPDMTISNNDISSDTNGSAISLRYAGARVFGNTIHDTPYAVSFFPQDPSNTGISLIYYNRMWNISGFAFYYAGTNDNGQPTAINAVWNSNTVALTNRAEGVNVSEITAAHVEVANNVFTGSIGSAYRGCATCSEHNNDWFGASTNLPSGTGDQRVDPGLSAAPALAPPSTSPVVDAGTAASSNIAYSAGCDGTVMHYCLQSPDQGAVEYVTSGSTPPPPPPPPSAPAPAADTTPPTVPTNLAFTGVTTTGGSLTWSASTDDTAVAGYLVSVNGGAATSTTTTSAAESGFTCGTSYSFAVRARDAAGNTSAAATLTASTAACTVRAHKHVPDWKLTQPGATTTRFTKLSRYSRLGRLAQVASAAAAQVGT
jgi:parallel beta helix pectate lyase-like protein/fibronectin type III domain protein